MISDSQLKTKIDIKMKLMRLIEKVAIKSIGH